MTFLLVVTLLSACKPTSTANVLDYMAADYLGTLRTPAPALPTGVLTGLVLDTGLPVAGATVLVAERTGAPHAAQTDAQGRYRIEHIPPGEYVPAAVAPTYNEAALEDSLGLPYLITIRAGALTEAPAFTLSRHKPEPLPTPLAVATQLVLTNTAILTAAFPTGSMAQVQSFQFMHAGAWIDTLRVYLPVQLAVDAKLPMIFFVYPSHVDAWQAVSTAYAAQGYAVVAVSPIAARGLDIEAHAADAHVALELARSGALNRHIRGDKVIALGGSFSSAILHRLLDDVGTDAHAQNEIIGWVTVGGISNAFSGAADFYADKLELPEQYKYLIPALGQPNLYPLEFLRFSPVYTAAQLPPTLIIHTAVDHVIPIDQAYQLEAALRAHRVPVEVYYYEDVSHYLQIDEHMTDQARAMFYRVADFAQRMLK
ncbi:MAG: carboxypeptidase regulatory-like domain-containing protein [Chloroflexi bacterium]|nr:carboxypeptidase regulatory-like domain-containing protein [Chloroflexota bacterium]